MDAVNLQGVWLNFPVDVVSTPARSVAAGLYVQRILLQAQRQQEEEERVRKWQKKMLQRAQEYREARLVLQKQQTLLATYTVLLTEL